IKTPNHSPPNSSGSKRLTRGSFRRKAPPNPRHPILSSCAVTENGYFRIVPEVDDRDVPDRDFGRDGPEWCSQSKPGHTSSCPVRQGTDRPGFSLLTVSNLDLVFGRGV
ncbi:hypothetical protein F2P56_018065, partial [Juglans regia]